MIAFRTLLAVILVTIVVYTSITVAEHGLGLLPIFFGDIATMAWPGQFNLDFLGFLLLSGFWLAWRHQFSAGGLILGLCGIFGGAPLLTSYLLWLSFRTGGNIEVMLLGKQRA